MDRKTVTKFFAQTNLSSYLHEIFAKYKYFFNISLFDQTIKLSYIHTFTWTRKCRVTNLEDSLLCVCIADIKSNLKGLSHEKKVGNAKYQIE